MLRPEVTELPINRIRPIQFDGIHFFEGVQKSADWESLPVETVLYGHDSEPQYILVDGNHRTHRAHMLGKTTVPGYALTEDHHIRDSSALPLERFETMREFIAYYEKHWRPLLATKGIVTINDLTVKDWRTRQSVLISLPD